MSEAKHSPLPWRAPSAGIYAADGQMVASLGTPTCVKSATAANHGNARAAAETIDANAALIVRAVNSHADLLAACEKVEMVLANAAREHGSPPERKVDRDWLLYWSSELRAARAKAKGE